MITTDKDGKILFAVALNIRVKSRRLRRWVWRPHPTEYVHAPDAATARAFIIKSHRNQVDIIAVGPAIGYHVTDEKKVTLSA
jgi:hypothetical protein